MATGRNERDDDLMEPAISSHDGGPPPDQPPAPFTINLPVFPTLPSPPLAENGGTVLQQSVAPVSIFHPAPPVEGYGNPDGLLVNRRRGHDTQTADDRTRERSRDRDIHRRPNRSAPPTATRARSAPVPAVVPDLPVPEERPLPFREASTRPEELSPQRHTPTRRGQQQERHHNKKKKVELQEQEFNYQEGGSSSSTTRRNNEEIPLPVQQDEDDDDDEQPDRPHDVPH